MSKPEKLNLVATVGGKLRRVISIMEQADGNVQLFLFWAESPGSRPTPRRIKQQKYSLHLSPNSPEFNLLKGTVKNDLGEVTTTTYLTDAVKSKGTFARIFAANFTDLESPIHDAKFPVHEVVDSLREFDAKRSTLFLGIFVGNPDSDFDPPLDGQFEVKSFSTQYFKIIILTSLLDIPASKLCFSQSRVTYHPDLIGAGSEAAVREHMRGEDPHSAVEMYLRSLNAIRTSLQEFAVYSQRV